MPSTRTTHYRAQYPVTADRRHLWTALIIDEDTRCDIVPQSTRR
jgi:hypothetical protein